MKYQYNIKILCLILLLIIIICITLPYFPNKIIENFDDKFDNNESYEEIYDKQFVELYEIIYRDFSDIDHDLNIVESKVMNNISDKNSINILVCGAGVGKMCKKLKEKYKNIIGVDISENMLLKAQLIYPNIKFVRGNIIKEKIFERNTFSHIFFDERTLYYNKPEHLNNIILNCYYWLKDEGYLIIPVYNPKKLQLASRYYSSKYMDNKGNIHGFTYLNDFSHDCYYIKDEEDKNGETFNYYDKIIFENGKKRIKKTIFYIPEKEKIYDIILQNGFDIYYIEKVRIQIVGGYEFVIFKKKKSTITVDEIQQKSGAYS